MGTTRGSTRSKYAGLLPLEPSDEVHPAAMKGNRRRSLGKRALRTLAEFLTMLCVFLAVILAWRFYGNMATQTIADLYRQLARLAPRSNTTTVRSTPINGSTLPGSPPAPTENSNQTPSRTPCLSSAGIIADGAQGRCGR